MKKNITCSLLLAQLIHISFDHAEQQVKRDFCSWKCYQHLNVEGKLW